MYVFLEGWGRGKGQGGRGMRGDGIGGDGGSRAKKACFFHGRADDPVSVMFFSLFFFFSKNVS